MTAVWPYAGDAFWILALSLMFSASLQASNRTAGEEKLRMFGAMLPRALALWALPGSAFAFSLWLVFVARTYDFDPAEAFTFFAFRAFTASLLPLAHLRLLREVVKPLPRKGP